MADLLTTEDLNVQLMNLDGWNVADNGKAITKTFVFADFAAALQFVNQVAALAQQQNHHPDIDIRYDKVIITLSTHSAGGVTKQDVALAKLIDEAGL